MATNSSSAASAPPASPWTPEMLAALPHDNAGTKLNVVMWVLICVSSPFLALRLYCKYLRHNGLWWDDYVLIGAWVRAPPRPVAFVRRADSMPRGAGVHHHRISHHHVRHNSRATGCTYGDYPFSIEGVNQLLLLINIAGSFSLTAAIWSKTSFALTLLRLTHGWTKALVWYIIISMNIAWASRPSSSGCSARP